jgi:uncharacterized protein
MTLIVREARLRQTGVALDFACLLELISRRPAIGWVEVVLENVVGHAAFVRALAHVRADYGLSLHCVGLSLGSAEGPDREVLSYLRSLSEELAPDLVSGHCAWSCSHGLFVNAMLPLPCTRESLDVVCRNVDLVQESLGRTILIENVAAYLRFRDDEMLEAQFLDAIAQRTGCSLLLDVNNLFVNGFNHGEDPAAVIAALSAPIGAFHLSGHAIIDLLGAKMLFDEHGGPVAADVWDLYRRAVGRWGPRPSFVEWDVGSPSLDALVMEALRADAIIAEGTWQMGRA